MSKPDKHNDSVAINAKSMEDIQKLYNYLLCAMTVPRLNETDLAFIHTAYGSAWGEINSRLQSRQSVHLAHMAGVLATFGYIASATSGVLTWLFAAAIPLFTLSVAFWSKHNDTTIGILSAYCQACERRIDPESAKGAPMFHRREQNWMKQALSMRRYSDYAFCAACFIAAAPSIFLPLSATEQLRASPHQFVMGAAVSLTIAYVSFLIIWRNKSRRDDLLTNHTFQNWAQSPTREKFYSDWNFSKDNVQPKEKYEWLNEAIPLMVGLSATMTWIILCAFAYGTGTGA